MSLVKFATAVKYNGTRIPAHTPFEVSDSELSALVAAGAFILEGPAALPKEETKPEQEVKEDEVIGEESATPSTDAPADEEEVSEPESDFSSVIQELTQMTTNKLKEYAEENGITIPKNGSKADIFNAIVTALKSE